MSLPVLDIGLIGVGTSLLREACKDIAGNDAFFANAWESEQGGTDPFPVYYKIARSIPSHGYDDYPGIDVSYSKSVDAWYHAPDPVISSTELVISLLGLALLAAIQPTGRILGRNFDTPWIVRCFPIVYAADALVALVRWAYLVVLARMGIRRAASTVLEVRLTNDEPDADAEEEHWMFALTKSKSATPARWVAFVMGGLPLLSKLWFAQGSRHAQVLGSMYLGAWVIFETFLLAATMDDVGEEDTNSPASSRKPEAPAAENSDDSSTESPVLVNAPADTITHTEKDKTASEPDAAAAPLVGGESFPVAAATVDVRNVPARTYSTFDTLIRRFCAAAIFASGIYHAFPLVTPEFFLWHERLTGDTGPDEAGTAMDIDSLVGLVIVVLSAYFWTGIVAQDLGTSWFSRLDDDGSVFEFMATAQSVSISLWIASWGSELFFGGGDEEDGYGHLLWYAVCLGAFALLQGVGRVRVPVGMDAFDVRRVVTLFISMSYYILEDDESKGGVARTVVCRAGGLCHRHLQGGQ